MGYKKGQPKVIAPLPPADLLNRVYEIVIDENGHGRLKMRIDCPWHGNGKKAGEDAARGISNGYRQVRFCGAMYREHRLVWKMVHGKDPVYTIDHIDRNKLNNNPRNLRDVPDIVNIWNKTPRLEHRHIYPSSSRKGYCVALPRLQFKTLGDAKTYRDIVIKFMIEQANRFNRSRLLATPQETYECAKVERTEMLLKDTSRVLTPSL